MIFGWGGRARRNARGLMKPCDGAVHSCSESSLLELQCGVSGATTDTAVWCFVVIGVVERWRRFNVCPRTGGQPGCIKSELCGLFGVFCSLFSCILQFFVWGIPRSSTAGACRCAVSSAAEKMVTCPWSRALESVVSI